MHIYAYMYVYMHGILGRGFDHRHAWLSIHGILIPKRGWLPTQYYRGIQKTFELVLEIPRPSSIVGLRASLGKRFEIPRRSSKVGLRASLGKRFRVRDLPASRGSM